MPRGVPNNPGPYEYKNRTRRVVRDSIGARLDRRESGAEILTGFVNGLKASDLEERYAKALHKYDRGFEFRYRISSALVGQQRLTQQFRNVEGEVEIDFIVFDGYKTIPVFIDGQIGHYFTPDQADQDAEKTNLTNAFGQTQGWQPSVRVPYWDLYDQDVTDRTVRRMLDASGIITEEYPIVNDGGTITNNGSGYIWKPPGTLVEEITNTQIMRKMKYEEANGFL